MNRNNHFGSLFCNCVIMLFSRFYLNNKACRLLTPADFSVVGRAKINFLYLRKTSIEDQHFPSLLHYMISGNVYIIYWFIYWALCTFRNHNEKRPWKNQSLIARTRLFSMISCAMIYPRPLRFAWGGSHGFFVFLLTRASSHNALKQKSLSLIAREAL